jgi:hypothetical protein
VNDLCDDFHNKFLEGICQLALGIFVPSIQAGYSAGESPDETCKTRLKMCKGFEQCTLYNTWPVPSDLAAAEEQHHPMHDAILRHFARKASIAKPSSEAEHAADKAQLKHFLDTFTKMLVPHMAKDEAFLSNEHVQRFVKMASEPAPPVAARRTLKAAPIPVADHLPLVDDDGDFFSTTPTLRGSAWRGRDCNDSDNRIYPGSPFSHPNPMVDGNCNGIFGVAQDGQAYEDKFCKNSRQRVLVGLGDSALAHFTIPANYLSPFNQTTDTYKGLLTLLENEADWPACSWTTGYELPSHCLPSKLPSKSIYQRLYERNRCNHRQYENIGVNGARTGSMKPPGIITTMKNRTGGLPATIIYALIGNDVCSSRTAVSGMTSPQQFYDNVVASLDWLDEHTAPNSFVNFVGLVNGSVLYNLMNARTHPVGVKYSDLYGYLNCLKLSPCAGWMNQNASIRAATTEHAMLLNQQYPKVITFFFFVGVFFLFFLCSLNFFFFVVAASD